VVDLSKLEDFERLVSAILDMAESVKRLKPPSASDGVEKVIAWIQDAQRAFASLPNIPNEEMLLGFGEGVSDSLLEIEQKIEEAKKPDEEDPWGGMLETPESFWAILGASSIVNEAYPFYQLSYPFTEVEKTAAAYSGWTTLAGGRTGTAYSGLDYSYYVMGGGAVAGSVVRIWEVPVTGQTTLEYWFDEGTRS